MPALAATRRGWPLQLRRCVRVATSIPTVVAVASPLGEQRHSGFVKHGTDVRVALRDPLVSLCAPRRCPRALGRPRGVRSFRIGSMRVVARPTPFLRVRESCAYANARLCRGQPPHSASIVCSASASMRHAANGRARALRRSRRACRHAKCLHHRRRGTLWSVVVAPIRGAHTRPRAGRATPVGAALRPARAACRHHGSSPVGDRRGGGGAPAGAPSHAHAAVRGNPRFRSRAGHFETRNVLA